MAWVTNDSDLDVDSVRFTGGQIRMGLTPRLGVELAVDRKKESFELLNEEVTLTPIQLSLLMRLAGGNFSPYCWVDRAGTAARSRSSTART